MFFLKQIHFWVNYSLPSKRVLLTHAKLATNMLERYGLLPVQITLQSLILRGKGLFCLSKHHQWMFSSIIANSRSTVSIDGVWAAVLGENIKPLLPNRSHYSRQTARLRAAREISACLEELLLHVSVTPNTKTHTHSRVDVWKVWARCEKWGWPAELY